MLSQLLANGIIAGCAYALVALGFALIYNTTKTFHFAHGAIYTISAYLFYTFLILCKLSLPLAIILSLLITALLGIILDELLYAPLVRRKASLLIQMLTSLGAYIVLVNCIAMFYGNDMKTFSSVVQPTYHLGSVIITQSQLSTLFTFLFLFLIFLVILRKTRVGIILRGMRDDPDLLSALGVNPRWVRWLVFSLGSFLAGVASLLNAWDVGIDPNIGMSALLNGAVALIIGGVGVFEGAVLGALLLGVLQSLIVWQASSRWQDTMTFLVLILFLLFRPQGIFGVKRRIERASQ